MSILQFIVESPPSVRWHRSRIWTNVALRRTFGHIGKRSVIVRPRLLRGVERIFIGDDCAVYEGAWLQCEVGTSRIRIGDGVYLGHGVHLHAGDDLTIGRGAVIADGAMISTTDHDRVDRHSTTSKGPIVIGNDVFVGERAIVLGGITIGDGATVGASSVVTHDVAPGSVVAGVPAREIKDAAT